MKKLFLFVVAVILAVVVWAADQPTVRWSFETGSLKSVGQLMPVLEKRGQVNFEKGRFGQAASLDGREGNFLFLPKLTAPEVANGDFTVALFVYPLSVQSGKVYGLIGKKKDGSSATAGWMIGVFRDESFWADFAQSGLDHQSYTRRRAVEKEWQSLVFVRDGRTHRWYLNGSLDSEVVHNTTLDMSNEDPLTLGSVYTEQGAVNGPFSFPGLIDEVIIDKRAWKAEDVKAYHDKGAP